MSDEEQRINPFAESPLYRYSEVVTLHDLKSMYIDMVKEYQSRSWLKFSMKLQLLGACAMLECLIRWIQKGKN